VARQTGDVAVAKALDFVRQIRKTPIVVNDARFFYANRCIIPYINEGIRMVAEGVEPALVENAAKLVGMPLGPLQLVDETSIDLGVKIAKATKAAMGDDYPDERGGRGLVLDGRSGPSGQEGQCRASMPMMTRASGLACGTGWTASIPWTRRSPLTDVQHRLLFAQVLEAVRALEDGVLTDIREGDVGAILGWGFAPWSGGPFGWLDIIGAGRAVEICRGLTAQFGPRFHAPALLREMAETGETFYGRFGGEKAAA
jgi:3-hydroxyacyl-CoA dehydrogenase/enoyl-CoA hydratase/3-hydroxybutyryl-CoA epimerase